MSWPMSQDYNEAIQSPKTCFTDPELQDGEVITNSMGLPVPCSGNFADVYGVVTYGASGRYQKWAVKCFTRQIPGLKERYAEISKHLQNNRPPFMVDFKYLDEGIRIRGKTYPLVKMHWVEGMTLNEFVANQIENPNVLRMLAQLWVKLAKRLREAEIAHCDLQHGNILLVKGGRGLIVKLVDYDGMCVPSLTLLKSIELGHPNFQHPQRLTEGTYNLEIDRFSHLTIYTALKALAVGGKELWGKYDDPDGLLFRQKDFKSPESSELFHDLRKLNDPEVTRLTETLASASKSSIEKTPTLDEVQKPVARPPSKKPKIMAKIVIAVALLVSVAGGVWLTQAGNEKEPSNDEKEPGKFSIRKKPAKPVDLLALIAKHKAAKGGWQIQGKNLVSKAATRIAILPIPYEPPDEYTISLRVKRLSGYNTFGIGLVAGDYGTLACFDAKASPRADQFGGFEFLDKKRVHENTVAYRGSLFKPKIESEITCTVRKNHIVTTFDGKVIVDWRGEYSRLSIFDVVPKGKLWLLSLASSYSISKYELRAEN